MIVPTVDKRTYTQQPLKIAGCAAITLKNGNDVRKAIEDMKVPEMVLPKDLPAAASAAQ